MKFNVLKSDGSQAATVKVDRSVFGIEPNPGVVHQAVQAELTNSRQGTHATKGRGAVRGGGRKPWRQKGRGVARAGSRRSPLWKGGGTAFGPEPHSYRARLPRKMRQLARRSVLSAKAREEAIMVLESLDLPQSQTRALRDLLTGLQIADKKVTILPAVVGTNLRRASGNLSQLRVLPAVQASTYDILDCQVLLMDLAGLSALNDQLGLK